MPWNRKRALIFAYQRPLSLVVFNVSISHRARTMKALILLNISMLSYLVISLGSAAFFKTMKIKSLKTYNGLHI